MAKQRMVNTKFWDDGFIRTLPAGDKLLFLYLLTNPCTTIAGAYEISTERIAFDTGMDAKRITEALDRLREAKRIIYHDGWMIVCKFIKNQSSSIKIKKGIEEVLKGCPDWVKDALSTSSGYPIDTISTLNSNLNSNLNVSSATQTEAVTSGKSKDTGDPLNRRIWVDGVELLTASGLTEKNARSFLGGLAKKHGQSALAEAIAVATVSNPVNADEWLVGRLKFRQNGNDKPDEVLPTASENLKLQVIEGVKPPPNGHQIAA